MRKLSSLKQNKKADAGTDSALIQVFYMALGIFVLLTFVKIILVFIDLGITPNEDVATQTGKSITDFTNYFSSGKYESARDCYNSLKLDNLENYQAYEKNEPQKNYFVVISEEATYRLPFNLKERFLEELNPNIGKKISEFDKKVELKIDTTKQGSIISAYGSGNYDRVIRLTPGVKFYILTPIFEEDYVDKLYKDRNQYLVQYILDEGSIYGLRNPDECPDWGAYYDPECITPSPYTGPNLFPKAGIVFDGDELMSYLLYKQDDNSIFFPQGEVTKSIALTNLCSYKLFLKENKDKYLGKNNGRNIDFVNKEVFFKIELNEVEVKESFKWLGGPICLENGIEKDCKIILKDNNFKEDIKYLEFIEKIEKFSSNEYNNADDVSLKIKVSYKELSFIDISYKEETVNFEELITYSEEKIDVDGNKIFNFDLNTMDDNEKKNNNIYNLEGDSGINEKINNCRDKICNDVFFDGEDIYFYIGENNAGVKKFATFNENFLRKSVSDEQIGYTVYYKSKRILYTRKFDSDKYGTSSLNPYADNKPVYWLKDVSFSDGRYDIILSEGQFNNIQPVDMEGDK